VNGDIRLLSAVFPDACAPTVLLPNQSVPPVPTGAVVVVVELTVVVVVLARVVVVVVEVVVVVDGGALVLVVDPDGTVVVVVVGGGALPAGSSYAPMVGAAGSRGLPSRSKGGANVALPARSAGDPGATLRK
jgi:hypothetical protein